MKCGPSAVVDGFHWDWWHFTLRLAHYPPVKLNILTSDCQSWKEPVLKKKHGRRKGVGFLPWLRTSFWVWGSWLFFKKKLKLQITFYGTWAEFRLSPDIYWTGALSSTLNTVQKVVCARLSCQVQVCAHVTLCFDTVSGSKTSLIFYLNLSSVYCSQLCTLFCSSHCVGWIHTWSRITVYRQGCSHVDSIVCRI